MTCISIIVAVAKNNVIGINNALPWHLPEDLKRFRALTTGHHIVMGRKTYESLGRLLPNRTTVIVTRNPYYTIEGALIAHTLQEAIKLCQEDEEVFLIGGAELYKDALNVADKLYITEVNLVPNGDAFFPEFDKSCWEILSNEQKISDNNIIYKNIIYQRTLTHKKYDTKSA